MPRFLTTFLTTATLALTFLVAPILAASDTVNYLALGDSIAFGFNPTLMPNPPAPPWPNPNQFTGYPEIVSQLERKTEANAACPGETSGSFFDVAFPDNGCNGPYGFKAKSDCTPLTPAHRRVMPLPSWKPTAASTW
jgi:hypothetical protein